MSFVLPDKKPLPNMMKGDGEARLIEFSFSAITYGFITNKKAHNPSSQRTIRQGLNCDLTHIISGKCRDFWSGISR